LWAATSADDIADPTGQGAKAHEKIRDQIDDLVSRLTARL
jgi:hypothetical protein